MLKRFISVAFILFAGLSSRAQHTYIPTGEDYYHLIDRYAIQNSDIWGYNTSIKPYRRALVNELQHDLYTGKVMTMQYDRNSFNRNFLWDDNWDGAPYSEINRRRIGKTRFKNFYQFRNAFFSVNQPDFKLIVNPVIGFELGYDADSSSQVFRNTRGAELRGSISDKIGFYSFLAENQFRYPSHYNNWIDKHRVVPGAGFIKNFGSGAKDFFVARGYVTVSPIKQIDVQFGHDRNFIGNGYRSLIMSDFAKENLFLKLHTQVWRIEYLNLFSEYTDYNSRSGTSATKKYGAFHYLNFNILPGKLNVGLFEHIIFFRNNRGYESQYLNPIIFYRAVEHGLNSTDNAMLGLDWRWNPKPGISVYGQYVLDEFIKNELFGRTGSWVNKWAFQSGVKWINAFKMPHLDLQVETNWVRPYMYTHNVVEQNLTHYNQPLAHPTGANFKEVLGIVRYQIRPKWNLVAKTFFINHGADSADNNTTQFGGDLLKDYRNRPGDDGLKIGQGLSEKIRIGEVTLSYQFYHRTYVDLRILHRSASKAAPLLSESNTMIYFGLRMNINRMNYDF